MSEQREHHSFVHSLLHFEDNGVNSTLWTKLLYKVISTQNFDDMPYHLGQTMESSLLHEVSYLTGISYEDLDTLNYRTDGPMAKIQWLYQNREFATPVQQLSLATSLTAIARYNLATEVLQQIPKDRLLPRQQLYYYFLSFILINREDPTQSCEREFAQMKRILAEETDLSDATVLSVVSQAIVWELKMGIVGRELFDYFVQLGLEIVAKMPEERSFAQDLMLSVFYRAYAMVPAEEGDEEATRQMMEKAYRFADESKPKSELQKLQRLDAIKTAFESELKEHLYVSRDTIRAEEVGKRLIDVDPNWSISYHELAEVYVNREEYDKALTLYQKAREIGMPRITFSEYMIGSCLMVTGRGEEALVHFQNTLEIDSGNLSAGISGYRLAKQLNHGSVSVFERYLKEWDALGYLTNEHKELIGSHVES